MTEEELEIIPATRSPHGYLASQLSDNIFEKDDGTLIVVGCPIARTGWQKYAVKDLPQARADALGVDVSNPEASIDLYRPAKEVFHPEFLASLNGCTITDGHPPGGEFVDPKNFNKYSQGHIQNVRKGTEPMEDGEWPIIADLVISAEPLIGKVRSKAAREISLGYDFSIDRDGDKIIQCSMLGNHNAVVPKGRAGPSVRIEDAMPEDLQASIALPPSLPTEVQPAPSAEVIEAIAYPPIIVSITNKEKRPVAQKKNWLRSLMGKHLIEMARAADADPEKIMDAAEEMHADDDAEPPKNTGANEFKSEDKKKGKDGELPEALKEHEFKSEDKRGKDRRSKDEDPDEDEVEVSADRKKAHDALDRIMDKRKAKDAKAKDANIDALKTLLDEFLSEEEKEPEHSEDEAADPSELEAVLAGEAEDAEECPECGEVGEDCACADAEEEEVESGEEVLDAEEGESPDPDSDDDQEDVEDKRKGKDRARAADAATAVLRMIRPFAARSNDKAFQATFNRALDSVKKTSRVSNGGYGKFASSARARDKAPRNPNPDRARAGDGAGKDPISKMQEFYNTAHKGGK